MNIEMEALEKNRTWEIVELPKGKKPMGSKQAFIVKYKVDKVNRKVQSEAYCQGIYPDLWSGLFRDLCTYRQDEYNKGAIILGCQL